MTDEAVKFAKKFFSSNLLLNDIRAETPSVTDLQKIGESLEQAAVDPDTNDFDVLVTLAADVLRENGRLPHWLAKFAADVLTEKRRRPTKRGADKHKNWERDYKLWRSVEEVSKYFSLPRYDNSGLYEKETAAGIVSQASGCSIDVVVTAYRKFKRQFSGSPNLAPKE